MSAVPQHPFRRSVNPRDQGRCACGQPQSAHTADPERSPAWEQQFIEGACDGYIDPEALIALAHERAHPGPLRDGHRRNWGREVAEELADSANYLPWWEQTDDPDSDGFGERQRLRADALRHVAAAFSLVQQAREL